MRVQTGAAAMPVTDVSRRAALALCGLHVALQLLHGAQLTDAIMSHHALGSTESGGGSETVRRSKPCFLDDIFASMRDSLQADDELSDRTLSVFGICAASQSSSGSSGSAFLELARKTSRGRKNGLEVLHSTAVLLDEAEETGALTLTFDLHESPSLEPSPALLLAFESPVGEGDLDSVTFTSVSLQPHTQVACISEGTQYILLMGKTTEGDVHQKWSVTVDSKSPDMNRRLKELLSGGKSKRDNRMYPLLLFPRETGTDASEVPGPTQTFIFLCELRRFLVDAVPQDLPESPPLKLDSLLSTPPLPLDLSSSEILLARLINSSAPTVFSFSSPVFHQGELALSPFLLEELRQRLDWSVTQTMEVLREEAEEGGRRLRRLERLKELSAFPQVEQASGESQYCAFLLLKALQTVRRGLQRGTRATRAEPSSPMRADACRLRSLTVSLERYLVGPNTADIKNCHGACVFPLVNTKNHAVLLNSHIESGNVQERAPCCVPVAYEDLEVVDLNQHGTYLSTKQDVVAKACGCR